MRCSGQQLWIAGIVIFEVLALSYFVLHAPEMEDTSQQEEALRRESSPNIRKCISAAHRDARFVHHNGQRCVTPKQRQQALQDAIYEAKVMLENLNIVYWIDSGTLLGQYRMGELLPWDTDGDMGILEAGFEVLRTSQIALSDGYELNVWNSELHAAHDRDRDLPVRLVETLCLGQQQQCNAAWTSAIDVLDQLCELCGYLYTKYYRRARHRDHLQVCQAIHGGRRLDLAPTAVLFE